ncbi:MAG: MATE family efflux transporter [Lachnospiraceae bacterium]
MKKQSIYRKALMLAVPMMIQNGITNAVSLVDSVMVGSLQTECMTGVSIVGQLLFVFNLSIFGGISGPGIFSAQFYGKGDLEGVRSSFRMKLWIGITCMLLGILAFSFLGDSMIGLYLHGNSEILNKELTMEYGLQYLQIILLQILPFVIIQCYASTLRETGEAFMPMIAGVTSVIVDVVLNYCLIGGHFGFPRLEVKGAAIATVIARIVELLIIVSCAHARKNRFPFLDGIYRTMLVPGELFWKMLKKGTPILLNEFLWAGSIAVLTQCYSMRGLEIVAGLNIANVLCNLFNVVFIALGNAVGILIGQMLGASKYNQAKQDSVHLMWFTAVICLLLVVILIPAAFLFPKFYNATEEVRNYGKYFIMLTACFFPLQGFLNALYFTLRSGGKTVITFLFDSGYSWVIAVPLAYLLCKFSALPILAIYAIVQCADFIKVTIGYVMIRKGIWLTNLAEEGEKKV